MSQQWEQEDTLNPRGPHRTPVADFKDPPHPSLRNNDMEFKADTTETWNGSEFQGSLTTLLQELKK